MMSHVRADKRESVLVNLVADPISSRQTGPPSHHHHQPLSAQVQQRRNHQQLGPSFTNSLSVDECWCQVTPDPL